MTKSQIAKMEQLAAREWWVNPPRLCDDFKGGVRAHEAGPPYVHVIEKSAHEEAEKLIEVLAGALEKYAIIPATHGGRLAQEALTALKKYRGE